ncbi:MAG: hypothetical protein ACKV2Q_32870 [Planctomycetaceae bacterium]
MRNFTHTTLICSLLIATTMLANRAAAQSDEPTPSPRMNRVRRAQQLVSDLQPQLRLASAKLLAESLDRSRQIGEQAHLLAAAKWELQQIESQLAEQRHQPGASAFQNAVQSERATSELRQHRDRLQAEHQALTQQHLVRLDERQRPDGPRRSEPQREALLSTLNSLHSPAPMDLSDKPLRVEVAKPVNPVPPPDSTAAQPSPESPITPPPTALPRTSADSPPTRCPPRCRPSKP